MDSVAPVGISAELPCVGLDAVLMGAVGDGILDSLPRFQKVYRTV